jgi:hypothetical protein
MEANMPKMGIYATNTKPHTALRLVGMGQKRLSLHEFAGPKIIFTAKQMWKKTWYHQIQ